MKNNETMNYIKKGPGALLPLMLFAFIFGLGGAAAGVFIFRAYWPVQVYNPPAAAEADAAQNSLRQANAIIENAKTIIASQENKVNETINASQSSLVGVFTRKEGVATSSDAQFDPKKFAPAGYYKLDEEAGEGLVVTSDGWILATDFSKSAPDNLIIKNFVVITKSKNVYAIDKIVRPGIDSYLFVHLSGARDLPAKSFAGRSDLANSQSLLALNWRGESYLTSIVDKKDPSQAVRDSDGTTENLILADKLGDYFDNAFIFSLNGQVVGFFDKKSGLIPLDNFQPLIKGLLEKKQKLLPSLGLTYVNLEDFAIKNPGYEKGDLVFPNGKSPAVKEGSAAKAASLQAGDIIVSVDNTDISEQNDLADIIQKYSAGDIINVIYKRNGTENAVKITLGELKP